MQMISIVNNALLCRDIHGIFDEHLVPLNLGVGLSTSGMCDPGCKLTYGRMSREPASIRWQNS